jgi:hypothetical protein
LVAQLLGRVPSEGQQEFARIARGADPARRVRGGDPGDDQRE